jgi:hypothetical protein
MRKIPEISSVKPNDHHLHSAEFRGIDVGAGTLPGHTHGMAELPSFALFLDRRT